MYSQGTFSCKIEPDTERPLSLEKTAADVLFYIAGTMRQFCGEADQVLWERLNKRHIGMKFYRLYPVGRFIADFVDLHSRIIIEIDESRPDFEPAGEIERAIWFKAYGFKVLRFSSREIISNPDGVMAAITSYSRRKPRSLLLRKGFYVGKREGGFL